MSKLSFNYATIQLLTSADQYNVIYYIEATQSKQEWATIRNPYNQVPHQTQDTTWESKKNNKKTLHTRDPKGQPHPCRRPQSRNEQTGKHDIHKSQTIKRIHERSTSKRPVKYPHRRTQTSSMLSTPSPFPM